MSDCRAVCLDFLEYRPVFIEPIFVEPILLRKAKMLIQTACVLLLESVLIFACAETPVGASDQTRSVASNRCAQAVSPAPATSQQPSAALLPTSSQGFNPVTIKQLRSDPKKYAQQNVAVTGQIAEISSMERYFELVQKDDSLRVLLDALPSDVQDQVYAAKVGSRVTVRGKFSGYVLYGASVTFEK